MAGWGPDWNGGIYHEGAPDTEWGRNFAFWKSEVVRMLEDACAMWLSEYRIDGLRFDSANDLPRHTVQVEGLGRSWSQGHWGIAALGVNASAAT
jgi:1,4-alpha-glucan branching enzyme